MKIIQLLMSGGSIPNIVECCAAGKELEIMLQKRRYVI